MADLNAFSSLLVADQGLCVVTTLRPDNTMQASVVNVGVMTSPLRDAQVAAFVARGRRKLVHLRSNPTITVVARAGWNWVAVEGTAELVGPEDPHPEFDDERLRLLLREIFTAAGGTHDDWDAYDRVMKEEGRTAVFVSPTRVYSNPS